MTEPVDDPYQILGVRREASAEEIRRQYKKLAVENHPDRNADPAALERFKQVSTAYSILNDPESRRRWDQDHAKTVDGGRPFTPESPLSEHRSTARSRPISQAEKRRREEFAERFAESVLFGKEVEAERRRRRQSALIQNTIAALLLCCYLISSVANEGLPFSATVGQEDGFLIFVFWGSVIFGLFLIWTPDIGQEVLLDQIPAVLLQFTGWLFLICAPLVTWVLSNLQM